MTAMSFLWLIFVIVLLVGGVMLLAWILDQMGTPDRPKRIILIIVAVLAFIIGLAYVLRFFGDPVLVPIT